ncbi:BON domain-containing protein [Crocosphaera sp. XPORK-15E]|uniref:BON domain-containing protein n=1 Tax=Crocosphaera sp. XPORK-15E TaxID=3110247 RepID=UPI002B21B19C|nr:BON domain-containing protein [Crocosphaera sp. XPORK-15E]MEA5534639.1 BON domain-containing protein [Crocosphaera sp. XPORK-15E]
MNTNDRTKSTQVIHREYKDPQGNLHTEYKDPQGNLHTEYKDAQGNLHNEYKDPQGNLHNEYRDHQGNVHTEYQDAQGNLHTEYQDAQGNLHTKYTDAQGNVHNEYTDPQGNLHTEHEDSHGNIQSAEEHRRDVRESRTDNNTAKGILIGVIIACVAGLSAGAIYFLTQQNNQQPVYIFNESIPEKTQESTPPPEKVPVVEQPAATVAPAPQAETPKSTETAPTQPSASNPSPKPSQKSDTSAPKPTVATPSNGGVTSSKPSNDSGALVPPSDGSVTDSAVSKTDGDLKQEIVTQFNNNLPNNQLTVEVKNGEVMVSGTVATPEQLQQIQPLLKSIKGIEKVDMTATVESK